jgi:hypothetical protein
MKTTVYPRSARSAVRSLPFPSVTALSRRLLSALLIGSATLVPAMASGSTVMQEISDRFDMNGKTKQLFASRIPGAFIFVLKNRELIHHDSVPRETYDSAIKKLSHTLLCKVDSDKPERRYMFYIGNTGDDITLSVIDSERCDKPFDPKDMRLEIIPYVPYSEGMKKITKKDGGLYDDIRLGKESFHISVGDSKETGERDPRVIQLMQALRPLTIKKIACKESNPTRKLIESGGRLYSLSFDTPFNAQSTTPPPQLIMIDECAPVDWPDK